MYRRPTHFGGAHVCNLRFLLPAVLGISSLLQGAAFARDALDERGYLQGLAPVPSASAEIIRFSLGNHLFQIPANALSHPLENKSRQTGVNIRLIYPEMSGYSAAVKSEYWKFGPSRKTLQILLMDPSSTSPGSNGNSGLNRLFEWGVLRKEVQAHASQEDAAKIGLVRYEVLGISVREFDYFVKPSDHYPDLSLLIHCSRNAPPPKGAMIPSCRLQSSFGDLSLKVSFVRGLLPEWQLIQARVMEWLRAAKMQP